MNFDLSSIQMLSIQVRHWLFSPSLQVKTQKTLHIIIDTPIVCANDLKLQISLEKESQASYAQYKKLLD